MTIHPRPAGRFRSERRGTVARAIRCAVLLAGVVSAWSARGFAADPELRPINPDGTTRTAAAVVVPASWNLAYTSQLLPLDEQGAVVVPRGGSGGAGSPRTEAQVARVLDRLESTLKDARSSLRHLVKVNVYATRLDVLPVVRAALARRLANGGRPAICEVIGSLSHPDAEVALDAIAATVERPQPGPHVAILPAGRRVFVSGQAAQDTDLAAAARKTLEELGQTLAFLGLDRTRVVQLKAYLQPAAGAAAVDREMTAFFGAGKVPPVVYVDWKSSKNVPIEIELVAAAGPAQDDGPTVEYLTPPMLKASPVFSRVGRVNRGDLIFVSGLLGAAGTTGADQVEAIFGSLKEILAQAHGDFRHLVKATYYVADDEASRALNELRPRYYDPKTPPAASKAIVPGVGAEGRSLTLDMIAVPAPGEHAKP